MRRGHSLRKPVFIQAVKGELDKIFGEKGEWVKVGHYRGYNMIGRIRQDLVWGD